jgi:hypothetical protein
MLPPPPVQLDQINPLFSPPNQGGYGYDPVGLAPPPPPEDFTMSLPPMLGPGFAAAAAGPGQSFQPMGYGNPYGFDPQQQAFMQQQQQMQQQGYFQQHQGVYPMQQPQFAPQMHPQFQQSGFFQQLQQQQQQLHQQSGFGYSNGFDTGAPLAPVSAAPAPAPVPVGGTRAVSGGRSRSRVPSTRPAAGGGR